MSYLVCNKCGDYYELQPGESPNDFSDECECGGKLKLYKQTDIPTRPQNIPIHFNGFVQERKIPTIIFLISGVILGIILLFGGNQNILGQIMGLLGLINLIFLIAIIFYKALNNNHGFQLFLGIWFIIIGFSVASLSLSDYLLRSTFAGLIMSIYGLLQLFGLKKAIRKDRKVHSDY